MNDKPTVLVTGANGFLGSNLIKGLISDGAFVQRGAVRKFSFYSESRPYLYQVGDISFDTNWATSLGGVDAVVHTAGLVHVSTELDDVKNPKAEYYRVNVAGTLNLAKQAAAAGVKRFIFISSIGVNGNKSNAPFTADDKPHPVGMYAHSKLEAECALWDMRDTLKMDIVIIRPPLIYGPHAPGNFGKLVRLIGTGLPLPFGCFNSNKRSFVAIDNLVDLIITCLKEPKAANQVFLAADNGSFSTLEFVNEIAKAMGKAPFVLPVPVSVIEFLSNLFRKGSVCQRLMGTLEVDITKNRELLGWEPPLSLSEALQRCFRTK